MGRKIADRATTPEDSYFASRPVSSDRLGLSHGNDTGKIVHALLGETRISVPRAQNADGTAFFSSRHSGRGLSDKHTKKRIHLDSRTSPPL